MADTMPSTETRQIFSSDDANVASAPASSERPSAERRSTSNGQQASGPTSSNFGGSTASGVAAEADRTGPNPPHISAQTNAEPRTSLGLSRSVVRARDGERSMAGLRREACGVAGGT